MAELPPDLLGALRALLLADAGLATAAGGRVFGGELPKAEAQFMPRAAIELSKSGGVSLTADTFAEWDAQRIDLFAYGRTPAFADQLAEHAALVLRSARPGRRAGVAIKTITPAGGQTGGRDPALAWPRAFRSFQVTYAFVPEEIV